MRDTTVVVKNLDTTKKKVDVQGKNFARDLLGTMFPCKMILVNILFKIFARDIFFSKILSEFANCFFNAR